MFTSQTNQKIRRLYLNIDVVACCLLVLCEPELLDADAVIDHDWVWRMQQRVQPLRDLCELHPFRLEYLLQESIAVDKLPLVGVLELVGLDVLPKGGDDNGAGLGVDPEEPRQPLVQLELQRLIVQQQQYSAPDILVSRSLNLKLIILVEMEIDEVSFVT